MRNGHTHQYIVGVDEAGRGPIAGPVTVAAVAFTQPFDESFFEGANDSKKLSPKKREALRVRIEEGAVQGFVRFGVYSTPSTMIDEEGIVPALKYSLAQSLSALHLSPEECNVKLDGSLKAPEMYCKQETIIRGDATELSIMLASIVAKTTRDREMELYGKQYPEYSFEVHKGYGTKKHYEALKKHGLCAIHRSTFIT